MRKAIARHQVDRYTGKGIRIPMNRPSESRIHPSLPPELLAAPLEFDSWSRAQLLVEQSESTPTEPLYHYTGEEALKGILRTERLWCFSHLHQSDRTEFEYSFAIARRVIKEVGQSRDGVTHHFCVCLDDLLENNSFSETFEFYLFSVSRHRDDRQQWENYGQHGRGFAIGFAPALFQATQIELKEQANENILVGRVIYGDAATEERHRRVIERAAEITSRIARANQSVVHHVRPSVYLDTVAKEVIASQLIWNCLTAKHISYANEREVRYVIMNVREKFDVHRKFHNGKHYVEAPLQLKTEGGIMEILVGPLAPAGAEEMIGEFLKAHGYGYDVPIRRSAVIL
jgi:Protein of unknown function (DUF2971)